MRHKFGCNMMHAQIFSENFIWRKVFEIPTSSATSWMVKRQLEWLIFRTSCMFSSHFDAESCPECLLSPIEVRPSWKHLYHSWVCVYSWLHPQTLVLTFWKSPKTFCLIWNKISRNKIPHKHIAHKNHQLLIAEKYAKQARHMFTLTETHCYAAQPVGPHSIFVLACHFKSWTHYGLTTCISVIYSCISVIYYLLPVLS